jgi:hypothetical protein
MPAVASAASSSGPHLLIRNHALRWFWSVYVSPRDSIRKLGFISKLSSHLAAPASRKPQDGSGGGDGVPYPCPPHGYGLPEAEIILLLRGSPRGLLDDILASVDLDGTGIITAAKLDIATRGVPATMPMRETLLYLAHQQGKKVVLPPAARPSADAGLFTAVAAVVPPPDSLDDELPPSRGDKADAGADKFGYKRKLLELDHKTRALTEVVHGLDLHRFGSEELLGTPADAAQAQVEALMARGCGWGLVFGDAGVGKTLRVLAACRALLRKQLAPGAAEAAAESTGFAGVAAGPGGGDADDMGHGDEEHKQRDGERPAAPGGSVLYADLRGAQSKGEVLAALAGQLGVSEGGGVGGAEEAEQRVVRMLGGLTVGRYSSTPPTRPPVACEYSFSLLTLLPLLCPRRALCY